MEVDIRPLRMSVWPRHPLKLNLSHKRMHNCTNAQMRNSRFTYAKDIQEIINLTYHAFISADARNVRCLYNVQVAHLEKRKHMPRK